MKKVTIIGLGYVGLPLARRAAEAGYYTMGVDTNSDLVDNLSTVETIFSNMSTNYDAVKSSNVVIVCVPTPINEDKTPDLTFINKALDGVGKNLTIGQLVSIESTVYPGYCESIGRKILETSSGLIAGKDFYLVHCPERINPGDKVWGVWNIPRVLGALNEKSAKVAKSFYSKITTGDIFITRNITEAETAKMIENAFRDINIAFVNELAKSFNGTEVSVLNVIKAAATKPFGYMPFYPGLGVGGHCIPVDPEYLISAARNRGFNHELLISARKINNDMVDFVVDQIKKNSKGNKIAFLGLTYKPNIPDLRESQAVRLRDALSTEGYEIITYDPFVDSMVNSLEDSLIEASTVIIATGHKEFRDIEPAIMKCGTVTLVFDTARIIKPHRLTNIDFRGIGV